MLCVPINGWYEWLKTDECKKPYYFHSKQDTMYVKSIMRENIVILLTTEAIDSISHIFTIECHLSSEPVSSKIGTSISLTLISIHMK